MPMSRRRAAIALLASLERFDAVLLSERVRSPQDQANATWLSQRLGEIEPLFLTRAAAHPDDIQSEYLDAAEEALAFYGTELRRLQDRAGVTPHAYQLPGGTH